MSSEPDLEAVADSSPPPAEEKSSDNKKNGKEQRKRDETPIEELFDLTKPIPKVDKPSKEDHDKAVQELTAAIDAIKEERTKLQQQIEEVMKDPDGKSGIQATRALFNDLKARKNALIEQKKSMRAQLDSIKNQTDRLAKDKKDTRSNLKFNSVEEIDAEIAKLHRRQETTTMSLNDEKKLIKEVEALKASKKFVSQLKDKDAALEGVKEQRKTIAQQIGEKDKEIDALTKEMDEVMASIKNFNESDTKKREAKQDLFKARDELNKQMNEKIKEKDALRDDFREKSNAFWNYQRAIKAQKKMKYEEEKRKREEEKAAYLAAIEAEEAKKIPYEEEQNLCQFLSDYLERTYLKTDADEKEENKSDVIAVAEDPFAGLRPVQKKTEDEYFGKGKGKKKRNRPAKKDATTGPFTLSVDMFEQFGLIGLTPPTSIEQVEGKVTELRERKEWYKVQPRGSVPTAVEIRKANEKAKAKLRQTVESEAEKAQSKPKASGFTLSSDEFIPLGAGPVASAVNSSWGVKASPVPDLEEEAEA